MAPGRTARRRRLIDPLHVVDVFVYVIVLNLATQFVPGVLTETFTVSLLTAVLLKLVLELVLHAKTWTVSRIRSTSSIGGRVATVLLLVVILPGSKLLVLEVVGLVFGDAVSLGGFFVVTLLIFVLLLSRLGVRWLLEPYTSRTATHDDAREGGGS